MVNSTSRALDLERLGGLLKKLTGEPVPFPDRLKNVRLAAEATALGIGYSQLNELLLLSGLDRITHVFYAYLLDGTTQYKPGSAFQSLDELEAGIDNFRKIALLNYGNVKFGFKTLAGDESLLQSILEELKPIDVKIFEKRHDPLLPIQSINPEEAYLTGYLIESELQSRLKNPADTDAAGLEKRRKEIVETAIKNQDAYLASDHLDVYVATSMRAQHEFISIGRIVEKIFKHDAVKTLKLRWFDPTQAYCANRIDKGLAEALMLRRASCTIYLAQETDTLGKDSELASTLAQGKPVIAFVPEIDDEYLREHFEVLSKANPAKTKAQHLMDQLQLFECGAAWVDKQVRDWCDAPETIAIDDLEKRVYAKIKQHYDRRAKTLRETHPLGIQVNLGTGVACGVIVVRRAADCAEIVRGIVTRTLEFTVEEEKEYIFLREMISKSIFRVMTSDAMLTNAFWNFYLEPAE